MFIYILARSTEITSLIFLSLSNRFLSCSVPAILIVASKTPICPNSELVWIVGYWAAIFAIVFCVVRGLPVVIEAKYLFEKK